MLKALESSFTPPSPPLSGDYHVDIQGPKSFASFASLTPKSEKELNWRLGVTIFFGTESALPVVAIADGLGSYTHARESAQFVTGRIEELANELKLDSVEGLTELFTQLRQGLRDHVRNLPEAPPAEAGTYGTTLLVAIETPNQLLAAYAGNGGIWHLRGNFDEPSDRPEFPGARPITCNRTACLSTARKGCTTSLSFPSLMTCLLRS